MKRFIQFDIAVFVAMAVASDARAQVVALVVGNQTSFNALDGYHGTTGQYLGFGYGTGTGPPGTFHFAYGPNNNMFLFRNTNPTPLLQYHGMTGALINTFVSDNGGAFTFGPDGNLYRASSSGTSILRYNGTNGVPMGTFATGLSFSQRLRFGPSGDLFVADGNTIQRVNGSTGALLGPFTPPGAGGFGAIADFVFAPGGKLLATGNGTGADRVIQFDSATGAFLGVFAQGNGLDFPLGITIGPDSNLYVASTIGNSIKRFDGLTGAFLGDFVSVTAHPNPTFIEFPTFPIPEPTSIALFGLIAGVGAFRWRIGQSMRKKNNRSNLVEGPSC